MESKKTTAGPSVTNHSSNKTPVVQAKVQEDKRKNQNVEQVARMEKKKKSDQDPFEVSLNFHSTHWSDSEEDDPDPAKKGDEALKQGKEGSKTEAEMEAEERKKLIEEVRSNTDKLRQIRPESKNQNETRGTAPKTVMERLKEVERLTQLEKRNQAQKNQLQAKVLKNLEINGKVATAPHLKSQTPTTRSQAQSQVKPQPLEPQVALCGLCNFANPFRTTQALIAHVRRAHEKAASENIAEIRHRVAPAKNYPATTAGKIQGEEQPVVDEEVARHDYSMLMSFLKYFPVLVLQLELIIYTECLNWLCTFVQLTLYLSVLLLCTEDSATLRLHTNQNLGAQTDETPCIGI